MSDFDRILLYQSGHLVYPDYSMVLFIGTIILRFRGIRFRATRGIIVVSVIIHSSTAIVCLKIYRSTSEHDLYYESN